MTDAQRPIRRIAAALLLSLAAATAVAQGTRSPRVADHIVAVVNNELVTAVEVEQRLARALEEARRGGQQAPVRDELRRQIVDGLIDERVLVTYARDSGMKVDEPEIDRAVAAVAAQNQLTVPKLIERLKQEGMDYKRYRDSLRDQILIERLREREVVGRIRVSDTDIDRFLEQRRSAAASEAQINIAQILIPVPEGADGTAVAVQRTRAEQALARVKAGEDFSKVAAELSQDGNRERGGEIGLRPASRLPDLFVDAVKDLQPGGLAGPIRSGAGFHVLKLLAREADSAMRVTQTRARHILLRPSAQLSAEAAARRLDGLRRQIEGGQRRFEDVAREVSEDGSAASGGDLGWVSPGAFVPEFEEAMNRLQPGGGLSAPVASRFGVHLIQVVERREVSLDAKQAREQARSALREQKFEQTYNEWIRDLRARAYVELREPPQ